MKRLLLGIDLQNDFCHPSGKLYVNGAVDDLQNILRLLENAGDQFDEILLSMDSHFPIHIAHASYWKNAAGISPEPFDNITYEDMVTGKWLPQYYPDESLQYLKALQAHAYQNTIWPPHCLIGTNGWNLPEALYQTLSHWSLINGKNFTLYNKGSNPFTEHYSILKAAVEFPDIASTCLDDQLLLHLQSYDEIVIVGEAMDFCVASTIKDMLTANPDLMQNLVILEDCMSSIIPDNPTAKAIYEEALALGATMTSSTAYLAALPE